MHYEKNYCLIKDMTVNTIKKINVYKRNNCTGHKRGDCLHEARGSEVAVQTTGHGNTINSSSTASRSTSPSATALFTFTAAPTEASTRGASAATNSISIGDSIIYSSGSGGGGSGRVHENGGVGVGCPRPAPHIISDPWAPDRCMLHPRHTRHLPCTHAPSCTPACTTPRPQAPAPPPPSLPTYLGGGHLCDADLDRSALVLVLFAFGPNTLNSSKAASATLISQMPLSVTFALPLFLCINNKAGLCT